MPYQYTRGETGLGFSLRPPKWLRDAVGKVVGGVHVSVPTPTGSVDMTAAEVAAALKGAKVQTGPKPAPDEPFAMPGGIGAIAAVGGLLLIVMLLAQQRGRRTA